MGLYLHLECDVAKRDGDLVEEIARFIEEHEKVVLTHLERAVSNDGAPVLLVGLHPAAEDVELTLHEGKLELCAKTSTAGPGFHRHVCELAHKLAEHFKWGFTAAEDDSDTSYFFSRDEEALDREISEWLAQTANHVMAMHQEGATRISLSMPMSHGFEHEGVVATPMGGRDLAWLRAVAKDGRKGYDVFPWAEAGTGAGFFLGRALAVMWTDVRWRTPVEDNEQKLLESVVRDLESAYRIDPDREYPWTEWAEILAFLGKDSLLATRAQLKAAANPTRKLVGYRREPVITHLSGGWSVCLPGDFDEAWDERGTFCGWDGTRTVWFTSLAYNPSDGSEPSVDDTLAGLPPLNGEVLSETEGRITRRCSFSEGKDGDQRIFQLNGYVGCPRQAAIATICYEDPDDREWAMETWRSILRTEPGR